MQTIYSNCAYIDSVMDGMFCAEERSPRKHYALERMQDWRRMPLAANRRSTQKVDCQVKFMSRLQDPYELR